MSSTPYVRSDIPEFSIPPYRGQRYEDLVPDTLDIQERAKLAVNGLTGPTDPEKDHLLYFHVNLRSQPPSMVHDKSDMCQTKFEESLPLMRMASGSSLNDGVDPVWMAVALRQIGPDGLVYWPFFPWATDADWGHPKRRGQPPEAPWYSAPLFCGRRLGAMTVYLLRDPSGAWKKEGARIVEGLRGVAIDRGDYAYYPQGELYPGQPRVRDAALPVGIWSSLVGWTIQGLSQYHRASGYEPAADLAGKLARYLIRHGRYYGPNGEFLPNTPVGDTGAVPDREGVPGFVPWKSDVNRIHFQHHTVPLLGLLDHALAAGDKEIASFVQQSFEWARTKGNVTLGYFPENVDNINEMETAETCEVAGMIGLALKLSATGLGDYWDDADRWIRNQFAENQLLRPDWIYRMPAAGLPPTRTRIPPSNLDPQATTVDRVPERNVGAFAGWPTANDWYIGHGSGIMHCCTGNGTRALYYVWEHMLDYDHGNLNVNLLLNRPSPWGDVHSHIPNAGRVDVLVKQPCRLRVRIPEWVQPGQAACSVNGEPRTLGWDGRYSLVGEVQPRDMVSVTFPIAERSVGVDVEKRYYSLVVRGNEVVEIDPPGRFCPLYQRSHYRDGVVCWKKVDRFVSEDMIHW